MNLQFIEMKKVGPRVTSLTDKERQTIEDNRTDDGIEFVRNENIFDKLKLERSFGMISTYNTPSEDKKLSFQYEKTINMKSSSDEEICKYSGIVLVSTSKVIVADYFNKKIKMIDVHDGSLISEITLSSRPRDITKLPQNKLAVALVDADCIQILSYTDIRLSLDRRIKVGERCYCVAYCQDKLVVGCNCDPGKLIVLDLDGNIKQFFDTPGLFAGPMKITISSGNNFLYISDCSLDISRCIKIDWYGNIVQRFEQSGYRTPKGIQVLEDTTLLVCYWKINTIVRLSSSFKICEVVGLGKENLLHYPKDLAYSEKDHKLYISCDLVDGGNGVIKVFNVEWV